MGLRAFFGYGRHRRIIHLLTILPFDSDISGVLAWHMAQVRVSISRVGMFLSRSIGYVLLALKALVIGEADNTPQSPNSHLAFQQGAKVIKGLTDGSVSGHMLACWGSGLKAIGCRSS